MEKKNIIWSLKKNELILQTVNESRERSVQTIN